MLYGYVPKTSKITVQATGEGGLADLLENMSDGKIHFAFIRFNVSGTVKFVYISWCGEGVSGMLKGTFATHAVDMSKFLDVSFS